MLRRLLFCLVTLGTLTLLIAGCSDGPTKSTPSGQDGGAYQAGADLYQPPPTTPPPQQTPPASGQDGAASPPATSNDAGTTSPPADGGSGTPQKDAKVTTPPPPAGTAGTGAVCTSDAVCKTGLICFKAEAASKKGTCVLNNCTANSDCQTASAKQSNYFSMCLTRQTWDIDKDGKKTNVKTFKHCGYFCGYSGKTYACPPSHACKALSGYKTCLPQ